MNSQTEHIASAPDLKHWRTEIPNLYDDADLDPYEFRLIVHYCRVGNCFQSVRTTAEKCHMSVGQVVASRKTLQEKGFIRTSEAEQGTILIEVVNKWPENFSKYSAMREAKQQREEGECSRGEHGVHGVNFECSHSELKKEPSLKNEPIEEDIPTPAKSPAPAKDSPPTDVGADAVAPRRPSPRQPSEMDRKRKTMEDHFVAVTGLRSPDCTTEAQKRAAGHQWWTPLLEILKLADYDVPVGQRLVDQAVAQLRNGDMTVADPRSIIKTARAIAAKQRAKAPDSGQEVYERAIKRGEYLRRVRAGEDAATVERELGLS